MCSGFFYKTFESFVKLPGFTKLFISIQPDIGAFLGAVVEAVAGVGFFVAVVVGAVAGAVPIVADPIRAVVGSPVGAVVVLPRHHGRGTAKGRFGALLAYRVPQYWHNYANSLLRLPQNNDEPGHHVVVDRAPESLILFPQHPP